MRFLPRLTYSNVVATLAIFIALGGISYAATNLSKNSVGTKQIKKNAVTSKKIKKNAVKSSKIKKNSVTTAKIRNGAVKKGKVDPALLASIEDDAQMKVLNADGSVLGVFAGVFPSGLPFFQVIIDGGIYVYYPSGQVTSYGIGSPVYKNDTCSGTPYVDSDEDTAENLFSKLAGGPSRIVFRTSSGLDFGPVSAWQFTNASENVVGQNLWERSSSTGNCNPTFDSPLTGVLTELDPVPAPPDGIGPLTIS